MEPELLKLVGELKTHSKIALQQEWLPDEETVIKIGETRRPELIVELEKALVQARKFQAACETAEAVLVPSRSSSTVRSSRTTSPFLAAMLAERVIREIKVAIFKCSSPTAGP